jgi:hypothetical protein
MPKHEKPLHWDMSFDEALQRVVQTDPRDLPQKLKAKVGKDKRGMRKSDAARGVLTRLPDPSS